jgi:hypothetical protein
VCKNRAKSAVFGEKSENFVQTALVTYFMVNIVLLCHALYALSSGGEHPQKCEKN